MNRLAQMLVVFAWILLAAALFSLFGLIIGSGAGQAVVSLGWLPETGRVWVTSGVWAVSGLLLLGLSIIYRRLASQDNAGSHAAWLAGWALLLYAVSSRLAAVSRVLVVVFLVLALAGWEFRKMIVGRSAETDRGAHPRGAEPRDDAESGDDDASAAAPQGAAPNAAAPEGDDPDNDDPESNDTDHTTREVPAPLSVTMRREEALSAEKGCHAGVAREVERVRR